MQMMMQRILKGVLIGIVVVIGLVLLTLFVGIIFGGDRGARPMMTVGNGGTVFPVPGTGMMGRGGVIGGMTGAYDTVEVPAEEKVALGAPASVGFQRGEPTVLNGNAVISPDVAPQDKKVMKTGTLDIRVQNADAAASHIRTIAEAAGGTVFSSNFNQQTNDQKSGTVTVKVPVNKFEETFTALKKVAALVVSESTSGMDVTNEYIDLSARLKSKQAEEQAYQTILGQAQKVSDILEITQQLSNVRGEIESLQGQLRYLSSQTDMAAINVFVTEDARILGDQGFRPLVTLRAAVTELLRTFGQMGTNLISFVIVAVPLFVLYGLILWGVFLGVRKLVRKFWQ